MSKLVIIGKGPAGISASLYVLRSGIDVEVEIISMGSGSLEMAPMIENYYGFPEGIPGKDLEEQGIRQAKNFGAVFTEAQVTGLSYDDRFIVSTDRGDLEADALLIATGSPKQAPNISGLSNFEGKGVSFCAICDGFFHRGKDVAVLGSGEFALHEAKTLTPIASSVTILTDGEDLDIDVPNEISVDKRKISSVEGEQGRLAVINFEEGESLGVSGLFIARGVADSGALARRVGAAVNNNRIVVDEKMATNVPGLYAAGDCTGGLFQICTAVSEGAVAGLSIAKFLK